MLFLFVLKELKYLYYIMPFFKKRRNFRRSTVKKAPKKYARGGRKSSVVSSAVKTYVNRTIHRQIENKNVQLNSSTSFGNILQSPTLNVAPLTPYAGALLISQGTGSANRTGNEVKTRRVMLKYCLYPKGYNAVSNTTPRPMYIQMWLGYVKNSSGLKPIASDFDQLYNYNNTVNPVLGQLFDLNQTHNTDYWTIKKYWIHKVGYAVNASSGSDGNNANYANNDFPYSVVKKLDITKFYPKTLKFNDTSTTISGAGLFFFFQGITANGDTLAASQLPLNLQWQLGVEFEDA